VLSPLVGLLLALDFNELLFLTLFFSALDSHDLVGNGSSFGSEAFHVSSVFTLINTLHERIFDVLHVLSHLCTSASLELFTESDSVLLLNLLL
jgi:hypothetical protein